MAGESGTRAGQALILIVILCAAGGWNYHRNAQIEGAAVRPYRSYSDEALHQLMSAYQDEVDVQMAHYRKSAGSKQIKAQGSGLLEERIDDFERAQRASQQRQERAYKVTDNQILVEQLAKEQLARDRDRPIYKMIFRRVTTL